MGWNQVINRRIAVLQQMRRGAAVLLLCGFSVLIIAGCKVETKMSPEDKANFNGGPMPAGYKPDVGSPAQSAAPPAPGSGVTAPK